MFENAVDFLRAVLASPTRHRMSSQPHFLLLGNFTQAYLTSALSPECEVPLSSHWPFAKTRALSTLKDCHQGLQCERLWTVPRYKRLSCQLAGA